MNIPFSLETHRDLLDKARRDLARLQRALETGDTVLIGDTFFDLSVTIHSVKDWTRFANPKDEAFRQVVESFLKDTDSLHLFKDLANGNKHRFRDRSANTQETLLSAPLTDYGNHEVHFPQLKAIGLDPLDRQRVLEQANEAIKAWEGFFDEHGI